jgi:hypothetical protein
LEAVLFTALLASASLFASAFGNLYSVYARLITDNDVPTIVIRIRRICYAITVTIAVVSVTAGIILAALSSSIDSIAWFVKYVLYLVLVLINITPIMISHGMLKDGSS